MGQADAKLLSAVIPLFNEEGNLGALSERLLALRDKIKPMELEIILVDDGSKDKTFEGMKDLAKRHDLFKPVRLARNYGPHAAVAAGISQSKGDCVVYFSGDMQDPPELIVDMLEAWKRGNKVVWARRRELEAKGVNSQFFSSLYHNLLNFVVSHQGPDGGTDFALFDRAAADIIKSRAQLHESIVAQLIESGLPWTVIPYDKAPRAAGVSGWNLRKKLNLVFITLLFSVKPLRLLYFASMLTLLLSFIASIAMVCALSSATLMDQPQFFLFAVIALLALHIMLALLFTSILFLGEFIAVRLQQQPRYTLDTGSMKDIQNG